MDIFTFHFTYLEIGLLAVLLLALFIQLYYYFRYFMGIIRHSKRVKRGKITFSEEKPPVSVVICARDEEENLRKFLPFILEQNYPDYEVIVVNDGSTDGTEDYLSLCTKNYPRLRTTFVPRGATNISTKKLGLTLGIKAAKNDLLLFTDADCMPEGKDWIAAMVRNFTPETEFVLGYGGYLKKKGFINKLIKFDTLFIAIQYLGMAAEHRPYMGVGRNLAYRKETFFGMKGFAPTLGMRSGDDDLMVNRGATRINTTIEVAPESVTWSEPKRSFSQWYVQKERHLSVSDKYTGGSKLRLAIEPFSRALFYMSLVFVFVFGNIISIGAAALLFIIRYLLQLYVINKSASTLGERKFYTTIPLFDVFLPLVSLCILLFSNKKKTTLRWK